MLYYSYLEDVVAWLDIRNVYPLTINVVQVVVGTTNRYS